MLNRQNLSNRIEVLKSKGVKSGREYVQLKPKRNIEIGQLVSAESEIAIAELISERFSDEIGITLHPCYPPPIDVDIEIRDQGAIFSVQVKTFEMITSRYGKRMSEAVKDWDTTLPQGENAYVARRYVGADLISEAIRPVKGVNRLARVGAFHFHPSVDDLWQMWLKIQGTLEEAQKQLCYASGIRVVVYDVRRSYIDGETLYLAVNDLKRAGASETYVEGVVILMYDFERENQKRDQSSLLYGLPQVMKERWPLLGLLTQFAYSMHTLLRCPYIIIITLVGKTCSRWRKEQSRLTMSLLVR